MLFPLGPLKERPLTPLTVLICSVHSLMSSCICSMDGICQSVPHRYRAAS